MFRPTSLTSNTLTAPPSDPSTNASKAETNAAPAPEAPAPEGDEEINLEELLASLNEEAVEEAVGNPAEVITEQEAVVKEGEENAS